MQRVLHLLLAELVVDGTGEMIGFAYEVGYAMKRSSDMAYHRKRYLMKHDRLATVEA